MGPPVVNQELVEGQDLCKINKGDSDRNVKRLINIIVLGSETHPEEVCELSKILLQQSDLISRSVTRSTLTQTILIIILKVTPLEPETPAQVEAPHL